MNRRCSHFLLALLLMTFAALSWAQESVKTPNDKDCPGPPDANVGPAVAAGRRMNIRVITGTTPNVRTDDAGQIALSSCQFGHEVAHAASSKLCAAAQANGYTCQGNFTGPFECCGPSCIIPLDCCDATIAPLFRGIFVDCSIIGEGGFTITRGPGIAAGGVAGVNIDVFDSPPALINAVNFATNGGNTVTNDPLPQHLENLRTNGVNGIVQWKVFHTQGGQNPRQFTVDTTGKTDTQIHQEIASKFVGLGLGLTAFVHSAAEAPFHSHYPQAFTADDDFVRIPNQTDQGVTEIWVTAVEGQLITIEDNIPGGNVPTLSTLGMVLLVVLLMLGAWFLHRRRPLQQA